jgi:hypothetical protein
MEKNGEISSDNVLPKVVRPVYKLLYRTNSYLLIDFFLKNTLLLIWLKNKISVDFITVCNK